MMTKEELVKALEAFDDDAKVFIGESSGGPVSGRPHVVCTWEVVQVVECINPHSHVSYAVIL